MIEFMNEHLLIDYKDYEERDNNINTKDNNNNNKNIDVIVKYENKYLDKIQKMKNEYEFTEDEKQLETTKFLEFLTIEKNEEQDKIDNKNQNKNDKNNNPIFFSEEESREKAKNYVVNKRLDKLMNSFVLDNTPLGNVIMTYNNNKEVFEYYSDNSIPYRFLESVARKYVITYFCRPLYVDMEEELKESEKKRLEKENEEKLQKEKEKEELNNKVMIPIKKSVFAKFKSYNKEGGSGGKISVGAAPPKNSIPNSNLNTNTNNENKFLLKEKTNRYNYQGKIANFSMIKKINKKDVNKKYAMTFAEFKKKMISS